jgi:hypothetical protein
MCKVGTMGPLLMRAKENNQEVLGVILARAAIHYKLTTSLFISYQCVVEAALDRVLVLCHCILLSI